MSQNASEVGECEDELELDMTNLNVECDELGLSTACSSSKVITSNFPGRELDSDGKKRLMAEYEELMKEIDNQNKVFNTLKMNLVDKALKPCKTRCEERELKNLRCILERENMKLQCLLRKAIKLQEEDPSRTWDHIQLATTFAEDSMPIQLNTITATKSFCDTSNSSRRKLNDNNSIDKNKNAETLLKKFLNEFECDKDLLANKEKLNILAKILKEFQESEKSTEKIKRHKKKKNQLHESLSKELCHSYNMQNHLANDNSRLEGDRYQLQNEIIQRDNTIDCLQNKIDLLQSELQSLCKEKIKVLNRPQTGKREAKENTKLQSLENNITIMENCMNKLKLEMNHLQNERNQWENTVSKGNCIVHDKTQQPCGDTMNLKINEMSELKDNYAYLLSEYAKKNVELKEAQNEIHNKAQHNVGVHSKFERGDQTEMGLLRDKLSDLQEEASEFKCLIKEQSEQLIEYQNKYLAAQQKVEEQKCILSKLEINNKKVEDQINLEIRRIKEKFQEKLKELIELPKLLENEQIKLAAVYKDKENLESKLRLVCKELKSTRASMNNEKNLPDNSEYIKELQNQIDVFRQQVETLQNQKQILCDKLVKTKDELDLLRGESAKIVNRTKERAEQTRCALQQRLDCVEKELAQCRATACLSISDREEVISEMQSQLNTIACNFETAQNQIKTLKNHITHLSKESSAECN